jgi:hypothetical protein
LHHIVDESAFPRVDGTYCEGEDRNVLGCMMDCWLCEQSPYLVPRWPQFFHSSSKAGLLNDIVVESQWVLDHSNDINVTGHGH